MIILLPFQTEVDRDEYMDMEEGEAPSRAPIDYTLYRKFWAIQDMFRNPTQCYAKDKWRAFSRVST